MKEKILYLIRGLPGSGKSTLAKKIVDESHAFEADSYFIKDGIYKFDPSKLKQAHSWCKSSVEKKMILESEKIAVSNTFTMEWEMEEYRELANKYGYKIFSIIVENRHEGKNVHGVPEEKLKQMRERFQINL